MITRMPRSCVVHRAALLDFVDGQPRTGDMSAALAHLERCRSCEDELAGIVRTVAALRRLGRAVAAAEPSPDAWPLLRGRITQPRDTGWRWRFSLGGVMMSTAAVALLTLASLRSGPLPVQQVFDDRHVAPVPERRYDAGAGRLTPGIVNAIAGLDVSARARLRSTEVHVAPSSVDRDERDRAAARVARAAPATPPSGVVRS
jgi:anti-sigma factor RsiW